MEHVKRIMMVALVLLLIPIMAFAEGDSVTLNAPALVSKNTEFTVDLVVTSEKEINEFKSTFTYETSAIELLSIENKNGWASSSSFSKESPLSLDFTHENGILGETTIATLKFKVKADVTKTNTTMTIEGTTKTKEDGTVNTLEKVTKSIDIKSTDNTLSDLKFNGTTIVNFSPNVYSYAFQVESTVTTGSFEAVLNDNSASFKAGSEPPQNVSLNWGENKFSIVVVAASGYEKTYAITVTRQDTRGTNNNLGKLLINGNPKLLNFDKDTLAYAVTTHKLKTVEITAVPEDSKATVRIEKPDELIFGTNEVRVIVVSENNVEKVYTIIINNSEKDVDTTLSNIELLTCGDTINFEKDVYDYEVIYRSKYKDSCVIKKTLSNVDEAEIDNATFEKDYSNLGPGRKVRIIVKSKDGNEAAERTYTIYFKKDTRINFFLILALIIFIVLLVAFIKLLISNKKIKKNITKKEEKTTVIESEEELEKTKRLEKVNLE